MRTLDDLQAVFADLDSAAPTQLRDPDAVLSVHPSRRRVVAVVAAAAVVIGVAVGVVASRHEDKPQPAKPSPTACVRNEHCPVLNKDGKPVSLPTAFSLAAKPNSGWAQYLHLIDPSSEQLQIGPTGGGSGDVVVTSYANRSAAPTYTRSGPAAVPGRSAYFVRFSSDTDVKRGVEWEDGGRDVIVRSNFPTSDTQLLSAASAVTTSAQPISLPFRFGELPGGLVPESFVIGYENGHETSAEVGFTDGQPTQQAQDPYDSAAVGVGLVSHPSGQPWGTQLGTTSDGYVIFGAPGGDVMVRVDATTGLVLSLNQGRLSRYSQDALVQIIRHMTFASHPTDDSTWFTDNLFPR